MKAAKKGNTFLSGLQKIQTRFPELVTNVSGLGLLISLRVSDRRNAYLLSKALIQRGVLVLQAGGESSVLMIEPPLVISEVQIQRVLNALEEACEQMG